MQNSSRFQMHRVFLATIMAVTVLAATPGAADLDLGLVANYPLDGDADDASVSNLHGTVYGDVVFIDNRAGIPASALYLDDAVDRIVVPNTGTMHLTGGLSLVAWVNYTQNDAVKMIVGKHDDTPGMYPPEGYYLGTLDGSLHFWVNSSVAYTVSPTLFNDGQWHLAVGTYDADADLLSLYVDGELVDQVSNPYFNIDDTVPLAIGSCSNDTEHFVGAVDDIRIYDRPLSSEDVLELYSLVPVAIEEENWGDLKALYR